MMASPAKAYDAATIYLFLSEDGVYRQRCGKHLPWGFVGLRPFAVLRSDPVGRKHSCVQCYWEQRAPEQFNSQQEMTDEYAE